MPEHFSVLKKKTHRVKYLILSLTVPLFFACATVPEPPSPEPLNDQTIAAVISHIQEQEKQVSAFYSLGNLTASKGFFESETKILIVGLREPFKMKLELNHTWGAPLLHILILETRLHVLSFKEKRYYSGPFSAETLSIFLPWVVEKDLIWNTLRGLPSVRDHAGFASPDADRIVLLNGDGSVVEDMELSGGKGIPGRTYFPDKGLTLTFSDYRDKGGIRYAREVTVRRDGEKNKVRFKNDKIVFNSPIPDELFQIEVPRAFTFYRFRTE